MILVSPAIYSASMWRDISCQWVHSLMPFHAEEADDSDEEGLTEEGEGEGDGEAEEDGTEEAQGDTPMGLGRATALAKLPSVSEWLRCCSPSHLPRLEPRGLFQSYPQVVSL